MSSISLYPIQVEKNLIVIPASYALHIGLEMFIPHVCMVLGLIDAKFKLCRKRNLRHWQGTNEGITEFKFSNFLLSTVSE